MNADPDQMDVAGSEATRGRRLWIRFSLCVAAAVLLVLTQQAFGRLIGGFVTTRHVSGSALIGYLGFGLTAGFAFGLAVILPTRMRFGHPRRALTLAVIPALVTITNVIVAAVGPESSPPWLAELVAIYTLGLQTVASVLLGVAAASAFAES